MSTLTYQVDTVNLIVAQQGYLYARRLNRAGATFVTAESEIVTPPVTE